MCVRQYLVILAALIAAPYDAIAQLRVDDGILDSYSGNILNFQVGSATQASVTGTSQLHVAEICDEAGANCSDVSSGLGGGGTASGVLETNRPDAIRCSLGSDSYIMYLSAKNLGDGSVYYENIVSTVDKWLRYDTAGDYLSQTNMAGFDCVTNTWSITDLYAQGRAFNFTGPDGSGDATTLDNLDSSVFVRNDQDGSIDGNLTLRHASAPTSGLSFMTAPTGEQLGIYYDNGGAGEALIDFNPNPTDGVGNAMLRFFRLTNTTGDKHVLFYRGNGTTSSSARIGVDGANSYFGAHGGNFGVNTASPVGKFHVVHPGTIAYNSSNLDQSGLHVQNSTATLSLAFDSNEVRQFGERLNISGEDLVTIGVGDNADGDYIEAMRIVNNGHIGISTTTPEARLTVVHDGTIGGNSNQVANSALLLKESPSVGTSMLAIDSNEVRQFGQHLNLGGEAGIYMYTGDQADGDYLQRYAIYKSGGRVHHSASNQYPQNATNSDVNNYTNNYSHKIVNNNNALYFATSNLFNDRKAYITAGHSTTTSADSIASAELVLQGWGGRVGIGDASPDSTLDVNGYVVANGFGFSHTGFPATPTGDSFVMVYDNNYFATSGDAVVFRKTDGNGNTPDGGIAFENVGMDGVRDTAMVIRGTGNVGILRKDPSVALDVNGSIEYTGTIADVSDERLKQNIQPLGSQLDKIAKVNPVSFEMKDNPDVTEYGVIAQELEEVYPILVHTTDDASKTKTVNYTGLIAPMIEAIQELKVKNENLVDEHEQLKQRVEKLEGGV